MSDGVNISTYTVSGADTCSYQVQPMCEQALMQYHVYMHAGVRIKTNPYLVCCEAQLLSSALQSETKISKTFTVL
jgi:hypothetical protein